MSQITGTNIEWVGKLLFQEKPNWLDGALTQVQVMGTPEMPELWHSDFQTGEAIEGPDMTAISEFIFGLKKNERVSE